MSEWKKVKLGKLYEVHNGLSKGRQFFGSGYPFLTFSTVFNNWFLPETLDSLVQSSDKERVACSIMRGDVFITRTSETMDELGMSSVALKDYPNATYNGFTKRLRPTTDEIIPEYIGYYLRSKKFRGKFMAFSSMTTRASLANDDLLSMEVEVPEKSTQIRIATILSRYDSLIENYQKQIKLLEEAALRLYKEWFVNLRFPGHESTKIVDGVPEGWEKKKVGDITPIKTGKKDANYGTSDGDYPFFTCSQEPIKAPSYSFDANAVILAGNGDFNVKLYRGKFEAYQRTYVLEPNNPSMLYLLFFCIAENMNKLATGASGSTIKFLTKGMIDSLEMFVPIKTLVARFNQYIEAVQSEKERIQSQIRFLTEARDRLLPKLMSGEIQVYNNLKHYNLW
jgi:type I restriction enzyme S subunit